MVAMSVTRSSTVRLSVNPAITDFFNKKVTTSTDIAVRSAGFISEIFCSISTRLEIRGITVIIVFTPYP